MSVMLCIFVKKSWQNAVFGGKIIIINILERILGFAINLEAKFKNKKSRFSVIVVYN